MKPDLQQNPMRPMRQPRTCTARLDAAPRCGARTRIGEPCRQAAMPNGRCRMHGGKSTGPRTAEGLERVRAARTKHGGHSAEAVAFRRQTRALLRQLQPS
jgi:hypothetical protein